MTSLRTKLFVGTTMLLLALGVLPARADTHAPNPQIFEFLCGDLVLTGISPNNHAKAGQFLDSTANSVAFLITFGGDVIYESPAYTALPDGLLDTCTSGDFTFLFLATF
jgi:hypothetical protein